MKKSENENGNGKKRKMRRSETQAYFRTNFAVGQTSVRTIRTGPNEQKSSKKNSNMRAFVIALIVCALLASVALGNNCANNGPCGGPAPVSIAGACAQHSGWSASCCQCIAQHEVLYTLQ